jgi:tRNA(fMet)-specific endonuclease VapC
VSFLLDTDTCSAYLRGHRNVFNRFVQHSGGLFASMITVGELYAWANRAAASPRLPHGVTRLLVEVRPLMVDLDVAQVFGRVRANLLDRGVVVPANDLFIAATALLRDFTIVTHNVRHFQLVPGLRIADWMTP